MKEILIVSNYYPPEKGAAANRIEQLALQLQKNNYAVKVICPLANYPHGKLFREYNGQFTVDETRNGIAIKRLWIFPSNSKNIAARILSSLSFSGGLFFYLLFARIPKRVIVQSPPLVISFVSVFALSIRNKKIILNVSDLWPLAAIELRAIKQNSFSHKISLWMEKFIYRKASVVLGQSKEIMTHVRQIALEKPCFLYRNYPDIGDGGYLSNSNDGDAIKFFYAGLLGVAQGIYEVCEKLDLRNGELHIFGDGAEKVQIVNYIKSNPEKKILFHGMLDRKVLMEKLPSFDIALVPLKTRIYGSVPSKIFEYSAIGMPILYFGGGEGEDIVRENNLGWVANVGDFEELNAVVAEILSGGKDRLKQMKRNVYLQSKQQFDLEFQVTQLIEQNVF